MNKDEIIKYIKYLRISHNYTQQQLADKLNLSRMTIVNIEQDGNPTIDTLLKIINHFDEQLIISPDDKSYNSLVRIIGNEIKESILNDIPSSTRHIKYGWVYIFNMKENKDIIKIGLTHEDDPINRLKTINSYYYPSMDLENNTIELYYARLTSDCYNVESQMHSLFDKQRINNEWFNMNAEAAKKSLDKIINDIDTPHLYSKE